MAWVLVKGKPSRPGQHSAHYIGREINKDNCFQLANCTILCFIDCSDQDCFQEQNIQTIPFFAHIGINILEEPELFYECTGLVERHFDDHRYERPCFYTLETH